MKILVIDDSRNHQLSAIQTLSQEHDVTVATSHDEACEAILEFDLWSLSNATKNTLAARGITSSYGEGWELLSKNEQESLLSLSLRRESKPYWDVVLSDLLMPVGKYKQSNKKHPAIGQEMPVGWSLVLQAAKKGVKFVALISDMNHHEHPASAMMDGITGFMDLAGSRALFVQEAPLIKLQNSKEKGKDWGLCLKALLNGSRQ